MKKMIWMVFDAQIGEMQKKKNISHYNFQNTRFRCFVISLFENEGQKESRNDFKIQIWVLRGQIFEFLGSCLRGLDFDDFLIGRKSPKT